MGNVSGYKLINDQLLHLIPDRLTIGIVLQMMLTKINVFEEGKKERWSEKFAPGGPTLILCRLWIMASISELLKRIGDETLACGTGVTASAICSVLKGHFDTPFVNVRTRGGYLKVELLLLVKK